ncbi:MAG: allantoate amidohydrolase [Steroidobacteraceae bacterium]
MDPIIPPPTPKRLCAGERAVARCNALGVAPFSESAELLIRRYLTGAHDRALTLLTDWMRAAGLQTRRDAMGNLVGRRAGTRPDAPSLLIGSHIDTVHNAGRYDGPLGVMMGIELAERLNSSASALPFAIEVIAFGDEEGSRFPGSMMCSRALAGTLSEAALDSVDRDGVSVAQALRDFGQDPQRVAALRRAPASVLAYLEAHIEQGPVLEAEELPVGVVTGIAAQLRMKAVFSGLAGHAGTSPMHLRRDALAAAAAGILAVEAICRSRGSDLVGTVGHVSTSTSAFNVIVGRAEIFIDIRSGDTTLRDAAAKEIRAELGRIAEQRRMAVDLQVVQDLAGAPCAGHLMDLLDSCVAARGLRPFRLLSGAGHDAMVMAALAPMAMLFVRCAGGISHNPRESVEARDVAIAIDVLEDFVRRLGTVSA